MPLADYGASYRPLADDLPDHVIAELRDKSLLDFSIEFYDRVLAIEPDYVDVLRCQGELLTRKGLHLRALDIDRRLAALRPNEAVVQYNLACSLALVGRRREAVAALRRAVAQGYRDVDFLLADPDLETLRHEPEYRALVDALLRPAADAVHDSR